MILKAGLEVCDLLNIEMPVLPKNCGTRWDKIGAPAKLWEVLEKKEHAHAIQFVACCQKVE